MALVSAEAGKLSAECLTPQHSVAAITGMTEIQRLRHLRYEAAYQLRIAPIPAAGKDQSSAANALACAVATHDLNAAYTTIGFCDQPVRDDFGQDDGLTLFSGLAQPVDKLPTCAARQTMRIPAYNFCIFCIFRNQPCLRPACWRPASDISYQCLVSDSEIIKA